MRKVLSILCVVTLYTAQVESADNEQYSGDERCPPPKDDSLYSPPYNAIDYPHEYPTFYGADKPGWSCTYQREDGVIIQYGDSRTPQQQWLGLWSGEGNDND